MNSRKIKSLKTRHQNIRNPLIWALDDLRDAINKLEGTLILGGVMYLGLDTARDITEAAEVVNASAKRFAKLIKREHKLNKKIKELEAPK